VRTREHPLLLSPQRQGTRPAVGFSGRLRRYPRRGLAVVVAVAFIMPVWWMVVASFKPQFAIFRDSTPASFATFFPSHATLENYRTIFVNLGLGRALVNSAIVSVCQVVLTLVICSMGAYAFSRLRFKGRNILFVLILATMLVPFESILIPVYLITNSLHLGNSLPGIFVPEIASAFGLFLLRQAFDAVPRELDESAAMDGASHFRIFYGILLPNIRPSLATLAIITFLWSWNGFLWPLVIVQSTKWQVVQVALAQTTVPGELPNWGAILAGATVATMPVLVLFVLLQRYIVDGFVNSGLKG
jgi:ABC-type glycerol-3-phosphate transport system permease component